MAKASRLTLGLALAGASLVLACSRHDRAPGDEPRLATAPAADGHLFTLLPAAYTGVRAENRLTETPELNVFTYRNFYNGGGVALGDLTGDGLPEIVLTSNQGGVTLYLNEGQFRFRDVTKEAGITSDKPWTTGVTIADVNGDGKLDIYVCHAGKTEPAKRANELWINQGLDARGVPTFKEMAKQYGVADEGYSTQAAFLDYDHDGDLDLLVVENSPRAVSSFGRHSSRDERDPYSGEKLYRNDGGHFTDVSAQAGIYGAEVAFGLGVVVTDVNRDGWPDIYVSNDFFEHDYLYINNRDGTFSEIGQLAGVSRTDWSWSALIADLDLDGNKDIYVTNGVMRDVTSQDYVAFLASDATLAGATKTGKVDYMGLINAMSSTKLPNYAFRNRGDLTFADAGASWGLDTKSFSNGAAYGDLDGDGAPDLVVSNVNDAPFVYRNNARALTGNDWLEVALVGDGMNRFGIGARVTLRSAGRTLVQEESPTRGFQSSVDYVLDFGLGKHATVDTLLVEWPDGRRSIQTTVAANQRVTVRQDSAVASGQPSATTHAVTSGWPLATRVLAPDSQLAASLPAHHENDFVDFDRERLIPKMLSTQGPFIAVGDVNGDGLDDLFIGGAKEQAGTILIQQRDGSFRKSSESVLAADVSSEDLGAVFFDADGDGDLDLYVVSGGSDFAETSPALQDRLYLNDGKGNFHKAPPDALPMETQSGSRVAAADFDGDGAIDLFVGGRVVPWKYGVNPPSMLLRNDGHGHFRDVTAQVAPELQHIGMVTDAVWRDVTGDGRPDLIVVGEWMPITIFRNTGDRLVKMDIPALAHSNGWWNRIVAGDFDGDGRVDFVVGNLGLNTRLQASDSEPVTMYVKDFVGDGFVEQVLTTSSGGKRYPFELRDDLVQAIPSLRQRFPTYKDYAGKTIDQVFTPQELAGAEVKTAYTFATTLVHNDGNGKFSLVPLPTEAQFAPVFGMLARDVNGDGKLDLLLAGNFEGVKPEIGAMSASYGLLLENMGRGVFRPLRARQSGFFVPGEARDIAAIRTAKGVRYIVTRNNDKPLAFRDAP